jgi:diguanylate cyclase (GGDEF)-like protein
MKRFYDGYYWEKGRDTMNEKILVVDDSHFNVKILSDILEAENYTVFSANNGFPVLEMAHTIQPDVILLDIMMPGIDGFEVCKILKNEYEVRDIPVIMVTARTDGKDIKRALEIGAFDYIKKPFDEIEVIARIQSALRLKGLQDRLKSLAMKDGLTGLYNHAVLVELLEKEVSKQRRSKGNLSFVMLDIDYFKKINDTYGHMAGDRILKDLSKILTSSVRKGDIVGRYGGEEFSIVLPGAIRDDAYNLCERIRSRVDEHEFSIGDQKVKITISIGVFAHEFDDSSPETEIIQKADELLYKAKKNGRNRVEV